MGTINYGTSDYITMGARLLHVDDFINDPDFIEEYGDNEEAAYNLIRDYYEADYTNIEFLLKQHSFYYFHVVLESGYYEGFYLDIENNFPLAFDSWEDKQEAQKEITEIKQFLIDCAGCGLAMIYPGWCTKEFGYTETIKGIQEAVKEMRNEVKNTPTWRQYEKEA